MKTGQNKIPPSKVQDRPSILSMFHFILGWNLYFQHLQNYVLAVQQQNGSSEGKFEGFECLPE